jgi:hypothetical protein
MKASVMRHRGARIRSPLSQLVSEDHPQERCRSRYYTLDRLPSEVPPFA